MRGRSAPSVWTGTWSWFSCGVNEENGVTGVLGVATPVDCLTFLADGDGVLGFRICCPLSLTPPFRLRSSLLCGAELEHFFQISRVPSPTPAIEAQFAMDSEISSRMRVSLFDVVGVLGS